MRRACAALTVVLALFGCALGASRAFATASTHIWAPSTDVQAYNVWHLTADMYAAVGHDNAGNRLPTVTNLGLTVGVLPWEKVNLEAGLDHKSGLGSLDSYPLYGNAKLGAPEGALGKGSPALAVGLFDAGTNGNLTDYNLVYGKVAKTFHAGGTLLGRLSVGYFKGNETLLLDGSGHRDDRGLLAAWERTIAAFSDKLWLCVEYMGTESIYGSLNVGASWKVAENVSVLGGYEIFNNEDLVDTITLQVDIDIH